MAYTFLKSFLTPILMLFFRPKVTGLRQVPNLGPAIIASNHLSFSDSIFMPLVVPRKVTFMAKSNISHRQASKVFSRRSPSRRSVRSQSIARVEGEVRQRLERALNS